MESQRNGDDDNYRQAFGEHTGISAECRDEINQIGDNDPDLTEFYLESDDAEEFTDLAWELLGGYIANNDHLTDVDLADCHLNDVKMSFLFKNWTRAKSLSKLDLSANNFGIDGIQSMVPFLKNARNISELDITRNHNINAECFRLLVDALHSGGGTIEALRMWRCSIDDITELENYSLPRLKIFSLSHNTIHSIPPSLENWTNIETLYLSNNNIGREGCRSIANLLQKEGSSLRELYLESNGLGCDEAEMLADSLKYNTSLTKLYLGGNAIKEEGYRAFLKLVRAFLKLLNNASSIDSTYTSNHTLKKLLLPSTPTATTREMHKHINSAIQINKGNEGNSHAAGRAKVIATQLNSNARMDLCRLQVVDYSYGSIFAEIDPILLPEVLALVGGKCGRCELYRMLLCIAPDLASIINRKVVIKQQMAVNSAKIASLTAQYLRETSALTDKNFQLNQELTSIESENQSKLSGRKRDRSASF